MISYIIKVFIHKPVHIDEKALFAEQKMKKVPYAEWPKWIKTKLNIHRENEDNNLSCCFIM